MSLDWSGARVLLTGGTGSFGREVARLLCTRHRPALVRVFSRDEWKQQQMAADPVGREAPLEFWIGDVRDAARVAEAASGCSVWIHAAALKQIPACEEHPMEAFKTNLIGTSNVLEAAGRLAPRWVICLSTDKAVQPANVYGASKMGAERLAVRAASNLGPRTHVCVVRYGNVLGSRGSVVPRFLDQKSRGRVEITDPRMTRFWITQERAADFVLRAPALGHGGEILVPKTPSLRLVDLARMLSPDSPTETVGVRPGEKLHETLLSEEESPRALELEDLFVVLPRVPDDSVRARYPGARPLPAGFRYSSDTNPRWWSEEEIRPLLMRA